MTSGWRAGIGSGLVAVAALACGGGGGSDGSGDAAITQGTSEAIAGAVVRTLFLPEDAGDVADEAIADDAGAVNAGPSVPGRDVPRSTTRAPFGPTPTNCDTSGSVIYSGDVATPNTFETGDQVLADFVFCDDDNGFVFDGLLDLTVTALTGDLLGNDFDATLDLVFTDFSADDGQPIVFDGDTVFDYDVAAPPIVELGLAGTTLSIDVGGETAVLRSYDLDMVIDEDPDPDAWVLTASGRLTHSEFTGEVDFDTAIDLEGTGSDPPTTGELVITGAGGATITVVPVDTVDVDLFLDLDGNGNDDVLVGTTWAALGL